MARSRCRDKAAESNDSQNEPSTRKALQKRDFLMARLKNFEDFIKQPNPDEREMRLREKEAEGFLAKCEEVYLELGEATGEVNMEEYQDFRQRYFKAMAQAEELTAKNMAGQLQVSHSSATEGVSSCSVRLPELKLPTFDGKSDWLSYYESFENLINKCSKLNNVQKFQYLVSSLSGEAKELIQDLQITTENYTIAWDHLVKRYHKQKTLIKDYLDKILKLPNVDKNNFNITRFELEISKNLKVLKNLYPDTDHWDLILIHILVEKLDNNSRFEWEKIDNNQEMPTMIEFLQFLKSRGDLLNSMNHANRKKTPIASPKALVSVNSCNFCGGSHSVFKCKSFGSLTISQRLSKVRQKGLCTNCLSVGHFAQGCNAKSCRKCGQKHHTLLHVEGKAEQEKVENTSHNVTVHSCSHVQGSLPYGRLNTLLATAKVKVRDSKGGSQVLRALLDSGSQSNFITLDALRRLNIRFRRTNESIQGLGENSTNVIGEVKIAIQSMTNNFIKEQHFFVLNSITGHLPIVRINTEQFNIPHTLKLADPTYYEPGQIDLLLGAALFWEIMCVGQIKLGKKLPILQKTKLGWILSGSCPGQKRAGEGNYCNMAVNDSLKTALHKFWTLEECQDEVFLSKEEQACVDDFEKNTTRDKQGRFQVQLPFKMNYPPLGDSYSNALRRFLRLEKGLERHSKLREEYNKFMGEYEELGHMVRLKEDEIDVFPHFYLPHHGVVKEDSLTTKLRVVFDASAKTSSGYSLNDTLLVGPNLQDDIFNILVRFRKHEVAFSADIEKMYRQVKVHPSHQDFQRIIWRKDPKEALGHYRLTTVTYGTASASYIAIQCLKQIGVENSSRYPTAAGVVAKDFYVDDLLTGAKTIQDAKVLVTELNKILNEGGLKLRKWVSNEPGLLNEIRSTAGEVKHLLQEGEDTKTLGVFWNHSRDTWGYRVVLPNLNMRVTKRSMLSTISRIFDPLGLLGPVTIKAKIMLQALWRDNLNWDESVPTSIYSEWKRLASSFNALSEIAIPRKIWFQNASRVELHGFCDASEKAFGACVYCRSWSPQGVCLVRLICAKSKVAPLRCESLPRLELAGAVLLSKLMSKVTTALDIGPINQFYWTDSEIVLAWLNGEPKQWKTFVSNRVAEIQKISPIKNWSHVPGDENPADIISRGANPPELIRNKLWWEGPQWLAKGNEDFHRRNSDSIDVSRVPERRAPIISLVAAPKRDNSFVNLMCYKFSNFTKIQRVTGYILRFVDNVRTQEELRSTGPLTIAELTKSMNTLIKLAQFESFPHLLTDLKDKGNAGKSNNLLRLSPFLDESGIIRVGGRLVNASLPFNKRHPALLSHQHPLTRLLIQWYHVRYLHIGATALLHRLRERFWVTSGLSAVKGVVRKCVQCFRVCPRMATYQMGTLPKDRVTPVRPFLISGVDFAGPFHIKSGSLRNAKIVNAYLALFVCSSSKAVHPEIVSDLTTQAFLACLKRFVSRRGLVSRIYSDNGTNFVGANNYLRELKRALNQEGEGNELQGYLNQYEIEWHFSPPSLGLSIFFDFLYSVFCKKGKIYSVLFKPPISACLVCFVLFT